jgi:hypothetical protein
MVPLCAASVLLHKGGLFRQGWDNLCGAAAVPNDSL